MKKINDLKSLRERQEILKLEMKISQEAFHNSVHRTKQEAKSYLLRNFLIPLGAGSLISLLFNKDKVEPGEKPSWLIFAEQAVHKAGEFFSNKPEEPVVQRDQPTAEEGK